MKALKQHIRNLTKDEFKTLKQMCKHSNALYNSALYVVNNFYDTTHSYIGYNKLYHEMKHNIHYKALPAKVAQQTLRLVDKTFNSFFALLKMKNKGQYPNDISKPKYRKSKQEFILIFPSDQLSLKNNKLKLTKELKLNFNYNINGKIKQAIIKPNNYGYYTIFISYEENQLPKPELHKSNVIGIDLGINNLATCSSNVGHSFIVNGKPLKSYNKLYNKRVSQIKSELKKCNNKHYSKRLSILDTNRKNYIDNYINQSINLIIKYCIDKKIGRLIIGYNEGWKEGINIGKVNNQTFMNIPHGRIISKLESKCEEYGIEFVMTEESYTSKCSFIDNEPMCHSDRYIGKRVKRGLFRSGEGKLINADVNGSLNIIRKVDSKFVMNDELWGSIVSPVVLNIF